MQRLGMSDKERGRYSLLRAINAAYTSNWSEAGLEAEWSRNSYGAARKSPSSGHAFMVPNDWILGGAETRDLTVGTSSAGGYLVGTKNVSFAELLRNRMVVKKLGATVLDNLEANIFDGEIEGFRAMASNQVPASTMIFGDCSDCSRPESRSSCDGLTEQGVCEGTVMKWCFKGAANVIDCGLIARTCSADQARAVCLP